MNQQRTFLPPPWLCCELSYVLAGLLGLFVTHTGRAHVTASLSLAGRVPSTPCLANPGSTEAEAPPTRLPGARRG